MFASISGLDPQQPVAARIANQSSPKTASMILSAGDDEIQIVVPGAQREAWTRIARLINDAGCAQRPTSPLAAE